jgi:hypothetical protein
MALADLLVNKAVSDFLLDQSVYATLERIAKTHGLPTERSEEFLDITEAVLDQKLPLEEVPPLISEAFGIDIEAAKKVASDVFGERVLPLEIFVPGIAEQIVAWGGKIENYPKLRVSKEKITALSWAMRLSEKAGITFSDVLLKRLAFLLEGRMNGSKNSEALRTFFGRALTIGGLGLQKEQNDVLIRVVENEIPLVELISAEDAERAVAQKRNEEVREEIKASPLAPSVNGGGVIQSPSHEIVASVPVISHPREEGPDEEAVKKAKTLRANTTESLRTAFEEAIETALVESLKLLKKKKISEKAFADLAGKAIRGVRDMNKTRDVLERDYKLASAEAGTLMDAIKKAQAVYHEGGGEGKPEEVSEETAVAIEEAEALVLDKRFSALTNEAPHASITPVLPGARVSAARTKTEEMKANAANISPEDARRADIARRPKPVRTELTVGSIAPQGGEGRKLTDVVTASRLVGPIEQLKSLTPVEFRRLSSNPAEAAQKVEDLLGSLEASAYEEKVKGVKALRQSPLNQLYLSITEEALSAGISIPEVSSKRRASGKESLSPAEMKALVQLNARLRF